MHRVFHGAHFQTLDIFRAVDGTLAVGHVAHAVLAPGQRLESLGVKLGQQFLADGAVQHGACMGLVTEQKRDVQNLGLWHKVGHRAGRRKCQRLRAQLHRLNRFTLTTERARVKSLNLVTARRAFFNLFGERVNGNALVRVLRDRNADPHRRLGRSRRHKTNRQRKANYQFAQFHGCLLRVAS